MGLTAKTKLDSSVSRLEGDREVELSTAQLIDLARHFHDKNQPDHHWGYQDFNRGMRFTGRCFLLSDLIALFSAYVLGVVLASAYAALVYKNVTSGFAWIGAGSLQQFTISVGLGLMAILWLDTKGHYRQRLPLWEMLGHFAKAALVGFVCGGFIQYALKDNFSRLHLGMFWLLFGLLLVTGRSLVRHLLENAGLWRVNALVIGNKQSAHAITRALDDEPRMGFSIVDQLGPESLDNMLDPDAWQQMLMLYEANHVFMALEGGEMERHHAAIKSMVRSRVPYSIVPPWLGLHSSNVVPHHFMMHDVFILQNTSRLRQPFLRLFKRSTDIVVSALALTLLSPLFLFVALIVRCDGGPAFFSQMRVGKNGKLFPCYKFRSMRVDAENILEVYLAQNPVAAAEWAQYQKLNNDVRVTRFGKFIRRTSIDELPQLFNVLKGDMSLVGPRPIMPGQEEFYAEDYCFYEQVRPGITGPWQVSGRSKLTFKERVALESWYARNWNPWTDIAIILKTFPALLKRGQAV